VLAGFLLKKNKGICLVAVTACIVGNDFPPKQAQVSTKNKHSWVMKKNKFPPKTSIVGNDFPPKQALN
jgi:hypothetical protein